MNKSDIEKSDVLNLRSNVFDNLSKIDRERSDTPSTFNLSTLLDSELTNVLEIKPDAALLDGKNLQKKKATETSVR